MKNALLSSIRKGNIINVKTYELITKTSIYSPTFDIKVNIAVNKGTLEAIIMNKGKSKAKLAY